MKLLFLGPPGAGKGTQAAVVAANYGIPQISTGAILREAIKVGSAIGSLAKDYTEKGLLVPDEIVIELVRERLLQDDCAHGYILDGFPRTVAQARMLDGITALDAIFNLTMEDDAIVERLSGRRVCESCGATFHTSRLKGRDTCPQCGGDLVQRVDDSPETIRRRLNAYHNETAPLVEYYAGSGKMTTLDGSLPLDEGIAVIASVLEPLG